MQTLASQTQLDYVRTACLKNRASMGASAVANLRCWRAHESILRGAIIAHIDNKRKIFCKPDPQNGNQHLFNHLHANVTLFEGKTIYVEMVIMERQMIILFAHEHTTFNKLPQ
ncbi:MAG: hypothetical protein LV481_14265 [Methylacidiphilales bacterium]|nr:hypothetical protein [Candidatus Methylacidiphilales bacterium]